MQKKLDPKALMANFQKVASLAGVEIDKTDVEFETLSAPHKPPTQLPACKMAVYVFAYGDKVLKVGKVGPRSNARYTSQHYNPRSATSTLAASLLKGGSSIGISGLSEAGVSSWIKENTDRINFLLDENLGIPVLSLLEAFLQCRLSPEFEGFVSQK